MAGLWRRIGREDPLREVDAELRFHLEMRAREYEESGLTPDAAREAALRSFGDLEAVAAACRAERTRRARERRRREVGQGLSGDIGFALRGLARNRLFAVVAVLTLGAGIGLCVAMAGLLDAYLLRSLPYPDADRLVVLEGFGAPDWRDPPPVLEEVAAWDLDALSIVGGGNPERVWSSWVTPGFFRLLGVRPVLGRVFAESEAGGAGERVAVISHGLWQRRWGGSPDVLGRTFAAYSDDRPDEAEVFTIIGVLPADFWYLNRFTEVLAPLRSGRSVSLARLAPGVTVAGAERVLDRVARERDPDRGGVRVALAHEVYVDRVRPVLLGVAGAVALVFLIACGNAAVLLLVRATGRAQEFAVRSALGAGRARLARLLVVEGLLLSALSAAAGLLVAGLALRAVAGPLPRLVGAEAPGGAAAIGASPTMFLVAVAICALVGVVFGLVPLVSARRTDLNAVLGGARGAIGGRDARSRGVLIAAELALSLSLLIGAALLVRTTLHLQRLELGFEPDGVIAVALSLRQSEYADAAGRLALYERLLGEVERGVPGARAALVDWAPFSRVGSGPVETPESPARDSLAVRASMRAASPSYFDVLGIRLVRGIGLDATHRAEGAPVAVVSESLARRLWPGQDPIGRQVRTVANPMVRNSQPGPWRTVIGVAAEVRKTLVEENPPDLYVPLAQSPPILAELVVRGIAGPAQLGALRDAIWRANPELPLNDTRRLDEDVALAALPSRFLAWLLSAFAGFAALLATVGLYGVVAYAVGARRREVAVRMALGADAHSVTRLFLLQGARTVAAGVALGLAGGYALARLLASQMHGVSTTDTRTYLAVATLLAAAALLAVWVPARRAAVADPMRVLERQ